MRKRKLAKMILVSLIATNVLYGGVNANAQKIENQTVENQTTTGWGKLYGNDLEINNVIYQNNTNEGLFAAGGVFTTYSNQKQLNITITNTTFNANTAVTTATDKSIESSAIGGALMIKGSAITFNDVSFNNNTAETKGAFVGGGAVFLDSTEPAGTDKVFPSKAVFNITKDTIYSGNTLINANDTWYVNSYGALAKSGGGFLYLDRNSSAEFNISDGVSLTIGTEDASGNMDSIASSVPINVDADSKYASISKDGSGSLTLNSDFNQYAGTLSVNNGTMNITKQWTVKNSVDVSGGSLNLNDITLDNAIGKITTADGNTYDISDHVTAGNITTEAGTLLTANNVTTNAGKIEAKGQFDIYDDLTVNKDTSVEMLGGGSVAGTTNINGTFTSKGVNFKGDINLNAGSESTLNGTNLNGTGVFTTEAGANVVFEDGDWIINKLTGDSADIQVGSNNKTPAVVTLNDNITTKNFTLKDGASLIINADSLSKPTEAAVTVNGGQTKIGDSSTIQVNDLQTGDKLKLFSDSTANQKAMGLAKSNNILQTFAKNGEYLEITAVDPKTVIGNAVITNVADYANKNSIDSITDFFKLGSAEKTTTALNALANIGELGGTAHGAYSMSNALTDSVHEHLSKPQHGDESDIWAKYIHTKENINGVQLGGMTADIDAQYNGIIAGGEFYNKGKASAGMAFMYADGSISSGSGAYTKNDAEYYGTSLYGRIDNGDSALIGDISYLHGSNDITQYNAGHTITASPDADAFSLGLRAEQVFDTNAGTFTPYAGLRYMHLGIGDYTDSVGLSYDADEQNLFLLPVGVKYSTEIKNGDWTIRPLAEAGYVWTMGDRDTDQTVRLGSAADSFGFEVADSGSFLGKLGVEFDSDTASYGFGYEYQKGDTVKANRWMANMEFKF